MSVTCAPGNVVRAFPQRIMIHTITKIGTLLIKLLSKFSLSRSDL